MIHTVVLEGYENHQLTTTQSEVKPYSIYIMSRDINEDWSFLTGFYKGIVRHNYKINQVDYFPFPDGMQLLSNTFYQEFFYCGSLTWRGNTANIALNQINCSKLFSKEIISIRVEDNNPGDPENSSLIGTELYGLGERYLIVCVPKVESQKFTKHSTCFLVDVMENKHYTIPEELGQHDTFLNVNNIQVIDNDDKKSIYFTTAQISYEDKKNLWNHREKPKSNLTESVVCIDYDLFIEQIKQGLPITERFIIDQCGNEESYILENRKNEFIYWYKHNFTDDTYILKTYNPFSSIYKERKIDKQYDVIYFFNEDLYGLKESKNIQEFFDVSNNSILFKIEKSKFFYYGNKEWIVFSGTSTNSLNVKWIVYDLINNKEVTSVESPYPTVEFIEENNTIVFIK